MDNDTLQAAIEGILFATGEAVSIERLSEATGAPVPELQQILDKMERQYDTDAARGIRLMRLEQSYQLCTKSEYYDCIRVLREKKSKLSISNAGMEVLSIVAYNQPVTRGTVEFIRGVNSDGAMNRLVDMGLIDEVGRLDAPGRPVLYATTEEFLRCFSLHSLDDLPDVDIEEEQPPQEGLEDEK